MNNFFDRLHRFAVENNLNQVTRPIIIAVSGGVDSMVVLTGLHQLSKLSNFSNLQLIVAHFDHQLRGPQASQQEATLIRKYCKKLQIPMEAAVWETPTTVNVEANAREARYAFFQRVAKQYQSSIILTGHHQNDQVETHLMRTIRGTSLKGLQGIQAIAHRKDMTYLRPLLAIKRKEVEKFAQHHEIPFARDHSNLSDDYFRNRIRNRLIPALEQENPDLIATIADQQAMLADSYALHLENFLNEKDQWIKQNSQRIILNLAIFNQWSPAKQRIYLQLLLEEILIDYLLSYRKRLIYLLQQLMVNPTNPSGKIDLGNGYVAIRQYFELVIQKDQTNEVPSLYIIDFSNHMQWQLLTDDVEVMITPAQETKNNFDDKYLIDEMTLSSVSFRYPQPGDRLILDSQQGKQMTKKLSRFFIDRKVPRQLRDRQKLLVTNTQEILWIPNQRFKKRLTNPSYQILFRNNKTNVFKNGTI